MFESVHGWPGAEIRQLGVSWDCSGEEHCLAGRRGRYGGIHGRRVGARLVVRPGQALLVPLDAEAALDVRP